jgi:hypothetical protein
VLTKKLIDFSRSLTRIMVCRYFIRCSSNAAATSHAANQ